MGRTAMLTLPMGAPYPIRERTSQARISRRWEIWGCAAPLFQRHGYRGVTIDQLAHAAAMSPATLYHYFPRKADIALFPLSHANGLCGRWHAISATLPDDPFMRLHALIGFAAELSDSWRLALELARQMSDHSGTAIQAARLLAEARRDFAEIAQSVDATITPPAVADLYEAFAAIVVTDLPGFDRSPASLRRRLTDAVRGWLTRRGVDPGQFDSAGSTGEFKPYQPLPASASAPSGSAGPL